MKINTYSMVNPHFGKIAETHKDKQGGAGSNAYERNQKKKDENEKEFEASLEAVEAAVEGFDEDQTNQVHGISASAEGQGPGLRVVLKSAEGGVLRSVSGEEFLKLRDAVASGAKSGRILDQKV
jgi:hypothetical protein